MLCFTQLFASEKLYLYSQSTNIYRQVNRELLPLNVSRQELPTTEAKMVRNAYKKYYNNAGDYNNFNTDLSIKYRQ